jgi:hypothetical protein
MKYIFLDESGDLGFSERSSKYLVITLLVCNFNEEQSISRIVKKTRQKILKKKLKNSPEIKWNNSNNIIKNKILNQISKNSLEIFSIILEKVKVYENLQKEKNKLYNYLCRLILSECSLNENRIELIVDRSKGKRALRDDFDNYIQKEKSFEHCNLKIIHANSKNNGSLQALDFASGAIFNKYEYGNNKFYNLIKEKISIERKIF